jgi:hypothetical protein
VLESARFSVVWRGSARFSSVQRGPVRGGAAQCADDFPQLPGLANCELFCDWRKYVSPLSEYRIIADFCWFVCSLRWEAEWKSREIGRLTSLLEGFL